MTDNSTTPLPIKLTLAEVKAAGLKAYEEKRLSAQNVKGRRSRCFYRDHAGDPCVIGAAMTDRAARRFDRRDDPSIAALVEDGLVETDDRSTLSLLQAEHDAWTVGDATAEARLVKLLRAA
jgi:hypothetical protein